MGAGASIADPDLGAAVEKTRALLAPDSVRDLWARVDFNGNGFVTLTEFQGLVQELQSEAGSPFNGLDNKRAMVRAFKASCVGGPDNWVERAEFPFLLRNVFFFENLWDTFHEADSDGDRSISREEFERACAATKLLNSPSPEEVEQVFAEMDTTGDNEILFDELCVYTANKFIDAADLDAAFAELPPAGKPPRRLGRRQNNSKGRTGRSEPTPGEIQTSKFDAAEEAVLSRLNDKAYLDETWGKLDFNGNNKVSLAEIDKMIVEQPDWQLCDNKPALMRAYKRTCSAGGGGDGDAWVEKKEFKALLANLFFYNKLFLVFDDIDTGDDRRIDFGEFIRGCSRLGLVLSVKDAEAAFDEIDRNDGGQILFDEFCRWVVTSKILVD